MYQNCDTFKIDITYRIYRLIPIIHGRITFQGIKLLSAPEMSSEMVLRRHYANTSIASQ